MTKSFAALAALATLATSAAAQSSVTIYGLVDLSVQHLRSGSQSPFGGANQTRLADGVVYGPGSRWGIRVSEDLGSGMVARVVLESGFAADTGVLTQGGRAFGRQSFIALGSQSAGELRLGRQYILHNEVTAINNPAASITALNPGGVSTLSTGTLPMFIDAPRVDNAVHYLSPTFGGFRVQGIIAPSEGTMDRYHGVKASYAAGPLTAAVSYEQSKALSVPPGGQSTVNRVLNVGANYKFGSFGVFAGFQRGEDLRAGPASRIAIGTLTLPGLAGVASEQKAYNIGASMPLGQTELMANYTHAEYSNAAGDVTLGRAGVGATYRLSRRTAIYGTISAATGDLKDDINERQVYQLGLRHTF